VLPQVPPCPYPSLASWVFYPNWRAVQAHTTPKPGVSLFVRWYWWLQAQTPFSTYTFPWCCFVAEVLLQTPSYVSSLNWASELGQWPLNGCQASVNPWSSFQWAILETDVSWWRSRSAIQRTKTFVRDIAIPVPTFTRLPLS
jgi:hypothetical protein